MPQHVCCHKYAKKLGLKMMLTGHYKTHYTVFTLCIPQIPHLSLLLNLYILTRPQFYYDTTNFNSTNCIIIH
jgi:hypothetical protein